MEYTISETNNRKQVILFLGTPTSNSVTIQKSEIAVYKWVTFTDALNLFKYEDHKQVLKQAHEFLG
ncbi:hypothetical protein AZF06_21230 [Priestia endophytica]|uniref:tRNA nucleotidyltransferase (CCA-adding enzyme) n=1 Tax=Priestia endophytica DSM 13796 TaxID=1121089 RepID=A0A1I5YN57_9BACI|nr:hypothetical protein AZF06_21230 [Priestia endophytica]SFQ45656.1 tRNA nucleotidyltransferase (CCA-adding enzyme) [Priestia endophytica DSM 13796]